jgi:hypothetical protein
MLNAYTYDALNRVDVATTKRSGGTLLYWVGYEYDLVENRINIDETSLEADDITTGTRYLRYEYDNRNQLTSKWWNADGSGAADGFACLRQITGGAALFSLLCSYSDLVWTGREWGELHRGRARTRSL